MALPAGDSGDHALTMSRMAQRNSALVFACQAKDQLPKINRVRVRSTVPGVAAVTARSGVKASGRDCEPAGRLVFRLEEQLIAPGHGQWPLPHGYSPVTAGQHADPVKKLGRPSAN